MSELLKRSLLDAPIIRLGEYQYFVHPITDGIPLITPELLSEVTAGIVGIADLDCDKIVTAEAMGIHIATALSLKTGIPVNIVRKRKYGLKNETELKQVTGYHTKTLYINGLEKGDRVLVVDDVLSTGGTLRALLKTLRGMGVEVVDVVIVIDKGDVREGIEKDFGIKIKTLVKVDIVDGKVVIEE